MFTSRESGAYSFVIHTDILPEVHHIGIIDVSSDRLGDLPNYIITQELGANINCNVQLILAPLTSFGKRRSYFFTNTHKSSLEQRMQII